MTSAIADGAVTQILARFLVQSREREFPADAVHEAKRAFLHWIGCAIGGASNAVVERSLATFKPYSGPEQATVMGRRERADILLASFTNAMSADVLGFSDTHLKTVLHPGGVVGPVVAALSEQTRIGGADALRAFLAGVEVACRIGAGVYKWHYGRGWHITGTVGTFGAAAAAGVLLKLDETRMAWALSMAATHAAGLRELFGSMGKSLHAARAAQNGLASALLAANEFTSSTTGIEGRRGFAHVLGDEPDLAAITEGLGTRFEILSNTYKPFPCGVVIHPVIDGCIELSDRVRAADVKRVALQVNPLVLELCGRREPKTTSQAKLSVFHSAAAALIKGRVTEQEYGEAALRDGNFVSLAARVDAAPTAAIREDEAHIRIELADGRTLEHHVEHAVGSEARPMSDADIERKFRSLAEPVLPASNIDRLIDGCWNMEKLEDVGALIKLAAAAASNRMDPR
jgi:2-methylcitrate dehydratase PrpD